MDNVLSYEVVLPNGTVTVAAKDQNPDLFWGLKGGFNNFGDHSSQSFSLENALIFVPCQVL